MCNSSMSPMSYISICRVEQEPDPKFKAEKEGNDVPMKTEVLCFQAFLSYAMDSCGPKAQ